MPRRLLLSSLLFLLAVGATAQDSATMISVDGKYLSGIDKKITKLDRQLTKQLQTYLNNLSKQEQRINKVLAKFDSSKAAGFFIESGKGYEQLFHHLR